MLPLQGWSNPDQAYRTPRRQPHPIPLSAVLCGPSAPAISPPEIIQGVACSQESHVASGHRSELLHNSHAAKASGEQPHLRARLPRIASTAQERDLSAPAFPWHQIVIGINAANQPSCLCPSRCAVSERVKRGQVASEPHVASSLWLGLALINQGVLRYDMLQYSTCRRVQVALSIQKLRVQTHPLLLGTV